MLAIVIPSILKTKDSFERFHEFKRQKTCFIGINTDFSGGCEKRNRGHFNPQNVGIKDTCIIPEFKKKKSHRESAAVRF